MIQSQSMYIYKWDKEKLIDTRRVIDKNMHIVWINILTIESDSIVILQTLSKLKCVAKHKRQQTPCIVYIKWLRFYFDVVKRDGNETENHEEIPSIAKIKRAR